MNRSEFLGRLNIWLSIILLNIAVAGQLVHAGASYFAFLILFQPVVCMLLVCAEYFGKE